MPETENKIQKGNRILIISGLLFSIWLYKFINPPLSGDPAYYSFFSKLVSDLKPIYAESTFGYTPMSALIGGYAIRLLGGLMEYPFEVLGLLGILNFLGISYYLLKISQVIYKSDRIASLVVLLFTGITLSGLVSVVAFDPKLFVCFLTLAGFYHTIQRQFFLAGLFFSFGFWSWQPALINLAFLGVIMLVQKDFKKLPIALVGIIIASLPSMLYIIATSQTNAFWFNAWESKSLMAGASKPFIPFRFLSLPFSKFYVGDLLVYVLTAAGMIIYLRSRFIMRESQDKMKSMSTLFVLTLFWCLLLSKEYGFRDLLAGNGVFVIWSGVFLGLVLDRINRFYLLGAVILLFTHLDLLLHYSDFDLDNQIEQAEFIQEKFKVQDGSYILVGYHAEGIATMIDGNPYKYRIRFNESNLRPDMGCDEMMTAIDQGEIRIIISDTVVNMYRECDKQIDSLTAIWPGIFEIENLRVSLSKGK